MTRDEGSRNTASNEMDYSRTPSALASNVLEDYRAAIEGRATSSGIPEVKIASSPAAATDNHCVDEASDDVSDDGSEFQLNERKRMREGELSAMELLEERGLKNRRSAHQSRLRKRRQLKFLEQQVDLLTEDKKKLTSTNETLTKELLALRIENARLRALHEEAVRIATALRLSHGNGSNGLFHPF